MHFLAPLMAASRDRRSSVKRFPDSALVAELRGFFKERLPDSCQEQLWLFLGADARHPLQVQMLICPLLVSRKLAETMPMAQYSPSRQAADSGLLGLQRQESMVDSHHHTQRYFQAMQCATWQI